MNANYTQPKVVKYKDLSKPWFVYIRYNGKMFKFKKGINRFKTYKERLREANALCTAIKEDLAAGWNPFVPEEAQVYSDMNFVNALEFALIKKNPNVCTKTLSAYRTTVKQVSEAAKKIRLDLQPVSRIRRVDLKLILEKAANLFDWSDKNYNKHTGHLGILFSELIQWDIIEVNVAKNIANKKVRDDLSEVHKPATDHDLTVIKNELKKLDSNFYHFIEFLFHTGIRPKEALLIKICDIDLKLNLVRVSSEISKTDFTRYVPINNHLMPFFQNIFTGINLTHEFQNYYLFGSFRTPGMGNAGPKNDFIPGPTPIKRDTATKRWNKLVKSKLGIDNTMYSFKHLGAIKKIQAGMSLDSLRELYGHKSKTMTLRYTKAVKNIYKDDIIKNSPEF